MAKGRKKKKTSFGDLFIKTIKELLQWLFIIMTIAILASYLYYHFKYKVDTTDKSNISLNRVPAVVTKTEKNYGKKVDELAKKFDLPANYLKALICLECSGRTKFSPRFEKRIYTSLKEVREGVYDHFGSISRATIKDASDDALKNLASSWGQFQLMGYQCIALGINVKDIRGDKSLYWGVYWINKRYGNYLRKKKYKDAFHIHNTGQPMPHFGKPYTYDPNYIPKGMKYMSYFELLEKNK